MSKRVLVIGSGGREHAIAWKLSETDQVEEVYVDPGNCGMVGGKVTGVSWSDSDVVELCRERAVELVVVGPEAPLAAGLADQLTRAGLCCFGPSKDAARIESDKDWAKSFMDRHGIVTARWRSFTDPHRAKEFINTAPYPALVVKASGLAAGKGVVVAATKQEACEAVDMILVQDTFGDAGKTIVVEELLEGEEVSVLAFCDGTTVRAMLPAQDHKRQLDGDRGGNTGGMGAYCPCPLLSGADLELVERSVLQRAVDGMKSEGYPFTGVLYAGLMLTRDGPKVLEFNCRFGDPETQVILPLLLSDLYDVMMACCKGQLSTLELEWKQHVCAVGVVMASQGYPGPYQTGQPILGLDVVSKIPNVMVFYSGVKYQEADSGRTLVSGGGRVLIAVAVGSELAAVAATATRVCETISFAGAQFRRDIAHKGIARSLLDRGTLTYKASGVDIAAGNSLVGRIKALVGATQRAGVTGSIGGFGGVFDIRAAGYKDPLLVSGTDGVGTKLKVAQQCGTHSTVGIDLVAMCVNDILANGAEPLFFLDYFACGHLDVQVAESVIGGIAEGCRQAGCALIGGETAEMPSMYADGEYDLAGFAVGAVERSSVLPLTDSICSGDVVLGVPSSGIHSNGFSLIRKVMEAAGVQYTDVAPYLRNGKSVTFGEEFLTPTKIYVKSVLSALRSGRVKAFAHITGGGLTENVPRVLPAGVRVELDAERWPVLPVFGWLAARGGVSRPEMLRTFNCGLGAVLVVGREHVDQVVKMVDDEVYVVGTVVKQHGDEPLVQVKNFVPVMEVLMQPHVRDVVLSRRPLRKRVAVLISGSGTNLQSLIDTTSDTGTEIVLVVSNKSGVQGLKRAERAGIPTVVIKHTDYKSRLEFDMSVHSALVGAGAELVCLAGFMRVLTGEFVRLWRGRLINIHPALLPLFKGTHAHRQALDAGVLVTGCTAHFVEEDIDAGAILAQEAVPIELDDTEETLQERVKLVEHRVFPRALKLVATGKVRLGDDNKLIWM